MPVQRRTIVALATGIAVATATGVAVITINGRQTPADMLAQGQAYLTGDGVDRNLTKAIAFLERAALSEDRANAREASLELVSHFEDSSSDASSQASAQRWRMRAAECGHRESAEALLVGLIDQIPIPEQTETVARAGAKAGSAYCMLVLGDLLAQGRGTVKQDLPGARAWYRKADEAGEPRGNARLALMLLDDPTQQADCLQRLIRAGQGGDAECAFHAGVRLLNHHGVEPDVKTAVRMFEQAIAAGHAKSCFELAGLLEAGVLVPQDLPRARALQLVASGEDPRACFAYAQMCELGIGGPIDVHTAMAHYARAAQSGLFGARLRMGVLCQEGRPGFEPNPAEAERHLRAAADAGDSMAQWRLSRVLVETGRGGEDAAELSAKAAKAAVPGALYDQYWFLLKGNANQPANRIAAIESLDAAVEANFPEALYRRGVLLSEGVQGVIGNMKDAADAFNKAVELDVPLAALQLGALYQLGLDAPPDDTMAASQYRFAAERGITEAQYRLGLMYEFGTGLPADEREAYRWYHLASAEGDGRAISRRAHLRTKLLQQDWQALEDTAPTLLLVEPSMARFYREQTWSPLDRRSGRSAPTKGEGFAGREMAMPTDRPAAGGSGRSSGPRPKRNRGS
ncbi:MAG: sel1 repeat family protein [Phycisphaerae bacterium]|nr:sel1 repeat family protein [Phycisphaerae bacterium]